MVGADARLGDLFSVMQRMEKDINDALDGVHSELDAVTDSVEMLTHTKAGNERVSEVHEQGQAGKWDVCTEAPMHHM